jgi:hypothetical protein
MGRCSGTAKVLGWIQHVQPGLLPKPVHQGNQVRTILTVGSSAHVDFLANQRIGWCCIDRLSWHGLPDKCRARTRLVRLARLIRHWALFGYNAARDSSHSACIQHPSLGGLGTSQESGRYKGSSNTPQFAIVELQDALQSEAKGILLFPLALPMCLLIFEIGWENHSHKD